MSCKKSACILGAGTPIGRQLIEVLNQCSEYNNVVLMGQRAVDNLPVTSKLVQRIINYEKLEEFSEHFENISVAFCALGSAQTKSEAEGSFHLEREIILKIAKIAKEKGILTLIFVSMVDTPGFIIKKDDLEDKIAEVGFDKLLILRPGALEDAETDKAPKGLENELDEMGEETSGDPLKKTNNLTSKDVAKAMIVGSLDSFLTGKIVWNSEKITEKALEFSI